MSSNMERLGDVFSSRMKKTSSAAVPTTLELGTIQPNMSLKTDSLPTPIPKGDYMVSSLITGGAVTGSAGTHGGHIGDSPEAGDHNHGIPGVKSGNRVLVAWCGNEPVVVAVVVSS